MTKNYERIEQRSEGLVSSMGKGKIVFKCLQCGYEQIIPNGIDGKRCEKCCGPSDLLDF